MEVDKKGKRRKSDLEKEETERMQTRERKRKAETERSRYSMGLGKVWRVGYQRAHPPSKANPCHQGHWMLKWRGSMFLEQRFSSKLWSRLFLLVCTGCPQNHLCCTKQQRGERLPRFPWIFPGPNVHLPSGAEFSRAGTPDAWVVQPLGRV